MHTKYASNLVAGQRQEFDSPGVHPSASLKICSKCGKEKSLFEFSRDRSKKDGRRSQCKQCYREYSTSKKGKRAHHKANHKYFRSQKGKTVRKRYRAKDKRATQDRANYLVWLEIRTHRMQPASECACEHCRNQAQEYHHSDYSKPLSVIPLCQECHVKVHGGLLIG